MILLMQSQRMWIVLHISHQQSWCKYKWLIQVIKNKVSVAQQNTPAMVTPAKVFGQPRGERGQFVFIYLFIFWKTKIFRVPVRSGRSSPRAFPPASLCSWWDQPLLGTLVVVTLQLPCERQREKGEGWERRGRDESKHHQRDRMTFLSSRPADYRRPRVDAQRQAEREREKRATRPFISQQRQPFVGDITRCLLILLYITDVHSVKSNHTQKGSLTE